MTDYNGNAKVLAEDGIIEIRGKRYKTVARRVADFRMKYDLSMGWSITTSVLHRDEHGVVIRAEIRDPSDRLIATGHAEEERKGSINLTSALENCETSAIGRALAAAGFAGAEYGSADELAAALEARERHLAAREELREQRLAAILEKMEAEDQWGAMEVWREMAKEEQIGMWRSFNSHQKKWLRDAEQLVVRDKAPRPLSEKDQRREDVRAAKSER